jgi:hypothetical protein
MTNEPPELDLQDPDIRKALLNTETARIPWRDLQRYFAGGSAIYVSPALDLLEAGAEVMADNKVRVEQWMTSKLMHPVTDSQALAWLDADITMWAVVLSPWVLVQPDFDEKKGA